MTKSIKLKECIVTPVDSMGFSPNWIQLNVVEESNRSYYWVVGMEDGYRFSLEFDFEESNCLGESISAYNDRLPRIKAIAKIK